MEDKRVVEKSRPHTAKPDEGHNARRASRPRVCDIFAILVQRGGTPLWTLIASAAGLLVALRRSRGARLFKWLNKPLFPPSVIFHNHAIIQGETVHSHLEP